MQCKILLFLPVLLCSVATFAQPVITGANYNPVAGDTVTGILLRDLTEPGPAGANVTWDFSSNTEIVAVSTDTWQNCSAFTDCGSYLGANIVSMDFAGNPYYYEATVDKLSQFGSTGSYRDLMRYPMTYQDSFTQTNTTSGSWAMTKTADGYGTLTTPAGTFTDALRLHEVNIDTSYQNGDTSYWSTEAYYWVVPGIHCPVYEIVYPGGTVSAYAAYATVSPTAVPDASISKRSIKVYPNPATTMVHIDFTTDADADVRVTLIDVTGRIVVTIANCKTQAGQHHYNCPTAALPRGVYYLRLQSDTTNVTRKVEVL